MSMLENIQTGRENKPPRIMVYGQEGVGKSTLGASAPDPIFIQTEDGLGEIDTCKFPLAGSLSDVLAELTALRDEEHNFRTVVIDSLDWLERLIFDEVCKEFGVRISCPTLCDPTHFRMPGSSVHRILQARILEWVAISFSGALSHSRDQTWVSCIVGGCFTISATREALTFSQTNVEKETEKRNYQYQK